MKKLKLILILALAVFCLPEAFGQKTVIRGRITDPTENQPVIGANIIEYDSDNRIINGTISNINGDFVLEMKNPGNLVKISVIGYETKEIPVDQSKLLEIKLYPSNLKI